MIRKLLDGHGQKWVWLVWSQDSKIGCISSMNWWNELIFCMVVQIQESKKLFQWFLGEPGQKWAWSVSSWDPKICWISLWIELIFCILTVMQLFLVRPTIYSMYLTFKWQFIAVLLARPLVVAGRIPWNRVCSSLPLDICLSVFLELDH